MFTGSVTNSVVDPSAAPRMIFLGINKWKVGRLRLGYGFYSVVEYMVTYASVKRSPAPLSFFWGRGRKLEASRIRVYIVFRGMIRKITRKIHEFYDISNGVASVSFNIIEK